MVIRQIFPMTLIILDTAGHTELLCLKFFRNLIRATFLIQTANSFQIHILYHNPVNA